MKIPSSEMGPSSTPSHDPDILDPAPQNRARQTQLAVMCIRVSPVRRLPPEILALIFTCCVDGNLHLFYDLISLRNAPMVLTHVCSQWRQVALTTPRLWENISLRLDEDPWAKPSFWPFIPEILQRSRAHPVFVDIRATVSSTHSELENILRLLTRAQTLKLELPNLSLDSLAQLPEACMPALRTLHLFQDRRGEWTPTPSTDLIPAFATLPELRSLIVSLMTLAQPPDIFVAQFPWSQLTYLNLGIPIELFAARTILTQCTNLVDGSFWDLLTSEDDHPPPEVVTLPNLCRFLMCLWCDHSMEPPFFDAFTFPALRTLRIDDRAAWHGSYLLNLHARSRFPLQELILEASALRVAEMISLLREIPTLRELRLINCNTITDDLFRALTYQPDVTAPALPLLELLEIDCYIGWNPSALADLIESRWPAISAHKNGHEITSLKRVFASGLRNLDAPLEHRFKKMSADGLLFELSRW